MAFAVRSLIKQHRKAVYLLGSNIAAVYLNTSSLEPNDKRSYEDKGVVRYPS